MNTTLADNFFVQEELMSNGEWKIDSYSFYRDPGIITKNETYPSTAVHFTIKRLSGAHAASIVIPATGKYVLLKKYTSF